MCIKFEAGVLVTKRIQFFVTFSHFLENNEQVLTFKTLHFLCNTNDNTAVRSDKEDKKKSCIGDSIHISSAWSYIQPALRGRRKLQTAVTVHSHLNGGSHHLCKRGLIDSVSYRNAWLQNY